MIIHDFSAHSETGKPTGPRFPDIEVELVGHDGNAFAVLGRVQRGLRKGGATHDDIEQFMAEAMSGDYDHLLRVCTEWVNVS